MSNRQPLGVSTFPNTDRHPVSTTERPEKTKTQTIHRNNVDEQSKLKRALADAFEQRRRAAEAEGDVQATKADLLGIKDELSRMRDELDKAKAKIGRRDDTIRTLSQTQTQTQAQAQANGPTGASRTDTVELEKKLGDLIDRHRASKAKYQKDFDGLKAQQDELRRQNAELKSSHERGTDALSREREKGEQRERQISELESQLRAAQRQTQHDPAQRAAVESVAGPSRAKLREMEEERTKIRAEKHGLEREVKRLQVLLDRKALVEEENERLEILLEASAVAYALLSRNSVPKKEMRRMEDKFAVAQLEKEVWKSRAQIYKRGLRVKVEEANELRSRLRDVGDEWDVLEASVRELRADRADLRKELAFRKEHQRSMVHTAPIQLTALDTTPLIDLALAHGDLSAKHLSAQLCSAQLANADARTTLQKAETTLSENQSQLTAIRRAHAELSISYKSLEEAHTPCAETIEELRTDLARSEEREGDTARALEVVKIDFEEAERRGREDREALRRGNEVVVRAKAAEDALDEEVQHLRQALLAAAPYETLYADLLEKQEIIESRESAAIDEAERLGMRNAALMSHTNGDQRINYVEGIRREMSAVKQELATTRHLLNKANDQITSLQTEVETYKSIDMPLLGPGLGGSMRTRVVRRQPEGGRVLSASTMGKRSISGPAGR